ncbi:MAG: DNA repair ATPase, partial [Deltaproteobacteria bacterium]|nr:DNA repair ATPase [Deltaproteobacteria bacterium]
MTDVDAGSYEVVRGRLVEQAKALSAKVDALNAKRRETFGGTELSVLATERIRTENNCVPCDVKGIGPNLLLGYNVFIGLKTETAVSDVFSVHRFVQGESGFDVAQLPAVETPFLSEPTFVRDFRDLYKYYKDTRLVRLQKTEGALLAVFQTGSSARDVKVFRWRLGRDGVGPYVDNRGDEEIVPPKQHDFEWTVVGRDRLVAGRFPHLSIEDEVFVETLHGDLTIKVENNTDSGVGIYSEPVDDPNQSLDDADVRYARVGGLLLLRIKPYREEAHRYFVFNTRTKRVARIDAVGQACVQLPEGQGVIFPGGYYLQTGDFKRFEGDAADLAFDRAVRSPNGEDVLYVFHRRSDGVYVLLAYNVIRKEVQTPITCHGMSLFDDGKLLVLRVASSEASRVHPVQIWQTPFSSAEHAAERKGEPTFLSKVGNSDLVRGISDCYSVCRLVGEQEPTRRVYEDLVALVARVLDAYYWLGHVDVGDLATTLSAIRATAELIVDEFDKVVAIRKRAAEAVAEAERKQREIVDLLTPDSWGSVEPFLEALTKLRSQRGHLITLRDLRYVDLPKLESLERDNVTAFDQISDACVRFLSGGEALRPLAASLDALSGDIEKLERSVDVQPVAERLETTGSGLTVLAEVVAGLSIGDPALRTTILEGIGEVFGKLNRVRAILQSRRKEIGAKEGRAEFGAQFKLLSQNVSGALALCDTPERCDEQLARAMVQVEEMEGRFGELDEFVGPLTEKREELFEAFGARKQQLLDERQRRAGALASAAERILSGLSRRARTFKSADELHAFYASDAMVLKVRSVAEQLLALGDSVRADELESRVKSSKQEALRALRDQLDLYEEGTDVIKLGRHRFNVNTQPVELTLVPRDGEMAIHVSGTGFYETVTNEAFLRTRAHWDQTVVSENDAVYRGEYLAVSVLAAAEEGRDGLSWSALQQAALARGGTAELVRAFAAARYEEGYERGIHDSDATAILEAVLALRASAGLLRFGARARTLACLYWAFGPDQEARSSLQRRASSLGRLRHAFGESQAAREIVEDVETALVRFVESEGFRGASVRNPDAASLAGAGMREAPGAGPGDELGLARHAATYLVEELTTDPPRFATSAAAANLAERLIHRLERDGTRAAFEEDLKALERRLGERRELVRA